MKKQTVSKRITEVHYTLSKCEVETAIKSWVQNHMSPRDMSKGTYSVDLKCLNPGRPRSEVVTVKHLYVEESVESDIVTV